MKFNLFIQRSGIAVLCILFTSQAMSYQTLKCGSRTKKWPSNFYTINANPTGFTGSSGFWYPSLQTAIDRVNATGSNFSMSVRIDNDSSVGIQNGESEIWWGPGSSAIAYTITDNNCNTIEGDIIMHNSVPYDDSMDNKNNFWNYGGGNGRTFETTAIHEIGHTVGMAHENRYYNIMGSDYTHVHTTGENALRSYVGEDMSQGMAAIYGSSNGQDLSVAAWRYIGASGQYSSHGRTRLFSSNGSELSSSKAVSACDRSKCERRYNVNLGQQIQYEMTLENNGRNSQSVSLGYYISSNANITTADTLIGTSTVTVTRNTPDTVRKNVTIPTNLNGYTNYYLGVIIDNDDRVNEWTEANNTSYMHIRTGPGGGSSSGGSSSGGSSSGGELTNGQTLTGLSASKGNDLNYYIDVPNGASDLVITMSSTSNNDADLYVKRGSVPTNSSYDCRPYDGDSNEVCGGVNGDPLTTSPGRYYIRINAFTAFSNVSLNVVYRDGGSSSGGSSSGGSSSGGSSSGGELGNGRPVTGLSASQGSDINFYIDVPSGASDLVVEMSSSLNNDADLYVKKGSVPTNSSYDCRPYDGDSNEICGGPNGDPLSTSPGRYYIRINAFTAFSSLTIKATYREDGGGTIVNACSTEGPYTGNRLTDGDAVCVRNGTRSTSIQYYYIWVPSNTNSIRIRTDHGSGNGSLYYKASNWATASSYDQRSTNSGNREFITVNNPSSGWRYVSIVGVQSGMALLVELQ